MLSSPPRLRLVRLLCALTFGFAACTAWAAEYHGQVFFRGAPVPGALVTLSQGSQTFRVVTDRQGLYEFPNIPDGQWKIEISMRGFTTIDGSISVAPGAPQGSWELKLLGLDQLLAQTTVTTPAPPAPSQTSLVPPAEPAAKEAPKAPEAAAPEPIPADQAAEKSSDGFLINGTENNASTSPFSLAPAFGNRRPGSKGLYNGGFGAIIDSSAFDARPYSLTGLQIPKDTYNRVTGLFTLGGPLNIPHLFYHGPNFFVAYQWTRSSDASTLSGLVPDSAERGGDLSDLLNAQGQPVTVYNPATGLPFTGPIPINPQAAALLNLYPLPNLSGNSRYNYQTEVLDDTHMDALQSRLNRTIGHKDDVYGGFGFLSSRASNANIFNFIDATDTLGIDTNVHWSHRYHHQMFVLLGYHFTRLRTLTRPEFDSRENISGQAGITGNDQDPVNWGPPGLTFSSGIAGLYDGNSEFNRNRTDAFSGNISITVRRHNFEFGGDFRKQEFNEYMQQNPRGSFTFTGAATQAPGGASGSETGSDLADFLLGIPDTSALAFGNPDKYFRQNVYDGYITDDWRMRPELTIDAGIRWDYGAPMTELEGRLVNLDVAPGYSAVAPVLANSPLGPLTGTKYPDSLVRPDLLGFEPRIGISWRPIPASTLVVRAGYGIYDDTSVYLSAMESMAQQAPLSTSLSVANSSACPLTLANGFRNCGGTTPDTFGIDPNFRVGYAQDWQLSVQRDLPGALVITATYLGIKGTRGMQQFLPNTYPIGATNPCPSCPLGFVYETSNGNSTREAGHLQLRRRLSSGLAGSLDYTYAKALDDDAQVGAQGHVAATSSTGPTSAFVTSTPASPPAVAQNWLDLSGERGLSNFDQRHLLKAQLQYTTGMGLGGETLLNGWKGTLFKEWTGMTQISFGSGLPQDPIYLAAVPGTGFTNTIRPDLTGMSIHPAPQGYFLNDAAYSAPAAGQWGTARRNSITGPNQFSLDASLSRTFRLRSRFNLDVRMDSTNLLNHGAYTAWNTVVNSTTFGLPAAVNPMRSLQLTARLRF
ncbi:MAG TPA: carboxypeptidase-like regulatory domain-containing protein [Terracidiphilus sp.]|nr:carboxypeptidase-like regulatory domain-containing protein [Terracidiphilus sp.]